MVPKIILHNSISLDGSVVGFDVNMDLHYNIAGKYNPDAHLIGSNTIKKGIELYGNIKKERKDDFKKPKRDKTLPYWVIPDTKGTLKGLLHEVRRFELCKDLIILISEITPKEYIEYLEERDFDYYAVGIKKIQLDQSFHILLKRYNIKKILVDTGKILGNILINQGFVSEISLLIHPVIVGKNAYTIFSDINPNITLNVHKSEILDNKYIWATFTLQ